MLLAAVVAARKGIGRATAVEGVMASEFFCGQEHRAPYPFVRATYDIGDLENGPNEHPTWNPGVERGASQYSDWCIADARGEVVYTVVALFKPASYPMRVFYLRHWVDPDGKKFGKGKLRITTVQNFRTLIKGYRHDYEIEEGDS